MLIQPGFVKTYRLHYRTRTCIFVHSAQRWPGSIQSKEFQHLSTHPFVISWELEQYLLSCTLILKKEPKNHQVLCPLQTYHLTSWKIFNAISMQRFPSANASLPDISELPPQASQLSMLKANFIKLIPSLNWKVRNNHSAQNYTESSIPFPHVRI